MPCFSTHTIPRGRKDLKHSWFFLSMGLCCAVLLFISCQKVYTPKPMAYPRLAYPRTGYLKTENLPYPVAFEYPAFARLEIPDQADKQQKWINLHFTPWQTTLYTGYLSCNNEESVQQHIVKNESNLEKENPPHTPIRKQEFLSSDSTVTGYLYEIGGNTACPLQFILTDGHRQIFRGSLYFNYIPNRDSIKNILDGMTADIRYLMESFRFKE